MTQLPSLGRIVHYRTKSPGRSYDLAAIITATHDTLDPEGVERGDVKPLSSPTHVHLQVLTPGKQRHYQEFDVPFDAVRDTTVPPGSWRWPARV